MTNKLFYEDAYVRSFRASVIERGTDADGTSYVVLDQTVFARGSEVKLPMNDLLKETLTLIDGKGGGSPVTAQGGGETQVPAQQLLHHAFKMIETNEE